MPIKVACQCGAAFAAPDHYAGKTVKCPKCSNPLTVPRPAGATLPPAQASAPVSFGGGGIADLLDEAGITQDAGIRCPKCQKNMPANAVVCVACGFNMQTGAAVATNYKKRATDGHAAAADTVLERAAADLSKTPTVETEQTSMGVLGGYIMAFGLLVTALVTLGLAYLGFTKIEASGNSQYYAGIVMIVVGTLMNSISHIVLLYHNFKAGVGFGIASLLIPLFCPIYGALSGHGFWGSLWFMGMTICFMGSGMMYFYGSPSEGGAQSAILLQNYFVQGLAPWTLLGKGLS
ncbi:MAG: hypothetical protein U1A77_12465 [Pirellulales bacterium]